jgi:putative tryptophan/tyrosine transport system substrate-binding protein
MEQGAKSSNASEEIMRKRLFGLTLGALLLALCVPGEAQQPKKVPRIGYLGDGSAGSRGPVSLQPFREGLRELGYVEGQDVFIEVRWTDSKSGRLPELVGELIRLKVDVIVTHGLPAARAAKTATTDIPIVVATAADMVGNGLVASLSHPGGNVTGTSDQNTELSGKQVQLLKELLPRLKRVAILENPMNPGAVRTAEETKKAARDLGLQVKPLPVRSPEEIAEAVEEAAKGRADALIVVHDPLMIEHRARIAQLALKKRLPTFSSGLLAEAGGLMTYGPDSTALFNRAAVFVDKILKGRKPADLPVEQPMKFELVINIKTAKQIGVTVPPNLLARADKVIR